MRSVGQQELIKIFSTSAGTVKWWFMASTVCWWCFHQNITPVWHSLYSHQLSLLFDLVPPSLDTIQQKRTVTTAGNLSVLQGRWTKCFESLCITVILCKRMSWSVSDMCWFLIVSVVSLRHFSFVTSSYLLWHLITFRQLPRISSKHLS